MSDWRCVLIILLVIGLAGCGGTGGSGSSVGSDAASAAGLDVERIDAPETVERGASMTIAAEINNSGDVSGSQQILATVGGQEISKSLTVEPNGTREISFVVENVSIEEGTHTVSVEVGESRSTATVRVENPTPYGISPVTVYIDDSEADRNMTEPTQSGLEYWETHDTDYLEYDVSYERTTDREEADIVVRYTDLTVCETEPPNGTELLGCAPLVSEGDTPPTPALVEIQRGMSDADTRDTVIHELGHVHGLTHADPPAEYLDNGTIDIAQRDPLKIHLRSTDGELSTYVRDEVGDGLDYFDGHEDLRTGDEFNWKYVDTPEAAHLVITYDQADEDVCFDSGGGSCTVRGEYATQTEFRLEGMSTQTVPWHVSSRLSPYLLTERPDGLDRDTSRRDRERWP
jgi:hypothetical protein